jgi:hypothetical protein
MRMNGKGPVWNSSHHKTCRDVGDGDIGSPESRVQVESKRSFHLLFRPNRSRTCYHTFEVLTAQRLSLCTDWLTIIFLALVSGEKSNFQFILRLLNTNVDGKQKIMYALTRIKGVGRRYSNLVCKKADVDLNKR